MYIGQYLPNGGSIYSPWFPREGDNAFFTLETIDKSGSGAVTVTVYHKNSDTPGPGNSLSTSWTAISGTNFDSAQMSGLREMVRFKFTGTNDWVIFRMLQPSWYDTANA